MKLKFLGTADSEGILVHNLLKSKSIDYAFIGACYDERRITRNHLNYLNSVI